MQVVALQYLHEKEIAHRGMLKYSSSPNNVDVEYLDLKVKGSHDVSQCDTKNRQ